MFDPKSYPFDATQMMAFFKANDFTKAFSTPSMPGFDTEALMAAQKKNMDALVEANKAAAAGYQSLFEKQVQVFEQTLAEAQKEIAKFDPSKLDADSAAARAEVAKAAFEKALANMTALAEGAQKANTEAFEIVSGRVQESVAELQKIAAKFTK
ncbi:MAG TPA: TIGR01841 family phasin [Paracoccaceae bacterium]|nr:TIGR01841 family phasin [Paracoccaceae bacterium]